MRCDQPIRDLAESIDFVPDVRPLMHVKTASPTGVLRECVR